MGLLARRCMAARSASARLNDRSILVGEMRVLIQVCAVEFGIWFRFEAILIRARSFICALAGLVRSVVVTVIRPKVARGF